jgi:hypothetical protein
MLDLTRTSFNDSMEGSARMIRIEQSATNIDMTFLIDLSGAQSSGGEW